MLSKTWLTSFSLALCLTALNPAQAAPVLFQNGTFGSAQSQVYGGSSQLVVSDFFQFGGGTIDQILIGSWTTINSAPTTVGWKISSQPINTNYGTIYAQGTSAVLSAVGGQPVTGPYFGWLTTFDIPDLTLAAGNYYLSLTSGAPGIPLWDRATTGSTPAGAHFYQDDVFHIISSGPTAGGHFFQLLAPPAPAPELDPASASTPLVMCLLAILAVQKRRRKASAPEP